MYFYVSQDLTNMLTSLFLFSEMLKNKIMKYFLGNVSGKPNLGF